MERSGGLPAGSRVKRALPAVADLWGDGWWREDDDDDDLLGISPGNALLPADCLPDVFPHHRLADDAEATYERDEPAALVHAVALAFDDEQSALEAWALLADPAFIACFAAVIAEDAMLDAGTELLGPTVAGEILPLVDARVRVAGQRATFAAAVDDAVNPVVLDVAVVGAGKLAVALWCASAGDQMARDGWDRLVVAVQRRVGALTEAP